jgi:hypothetical protein
MPPIDDARLMGVVAPSTVKRVFLLSLLRVRSLTAFRHLAPSGRSCCISFASRTDLEASDESEQIPPRLALTA